MNGSREFVVYRMEDAMSLVIAEIEDFVGIATLNNYQKRNCLSHDLIQDLFDALNGFEKANIRAVILRAPSGSKVWSAGHDVSELPLSGRDPLPYASYFEQLLRYILDYPVPVIAMIEGGVWGGGCDLALSCDIIIGCETTKFTMTPARLGIPYNPSGMIHFINVLGLNKAKEMFFTASPINAEDAYNVGIINHLVPPEELERFTRDIAIKISTNAPLAIRALKEEFRLLTKGHSLDSESFEKIQAIRRLVYDSEDYKEGIQAFFEKRPPQFRGK